MVDHDARLTAEAQQILSGPLSWRLNDIIESTKLRTVPAVYVIKPSTGQLCEVTMSAGDDGSLSVTKEALDLAVDRMELEIGVIYGGRTDVFTESSLCRTRKPLGYEIGGKREMSRVEHIMMSLSSLWVARFLS